MFGGPAPPPGLALGGPPPPPPGMFGGPAPPPGLALGGPAPPPGLSLGGPAPPPGIALGGPAPPPGLALGGPAPPPGLALGGSVATQAPIKKVKMKVLMWAKMPNNLLVNSIWKDVLNTPPTMNPEYADLIKLFEDKRKVTRVTTQKKVVIEEISIVDDPKRVQSMQIGVKKLTAVNKLSYDTIRQMLLNIDDSIIGPDPFTNLKQLAPTREELES